jgi:hypothetical protein
LGSIQAYHLARNENQNKQEDAKHDENADQNKSSLADEPNEQKFDI